MSNKKDYFNKCFSPNWIEVDLETVDRQQKEVTKTSNESYKNVRTQENREVRLENKQRKDLKTLLKELDEIKQNIEKVAEKQHQLANLMSFYNKDFVQ